jgi:type III secretory pathway component EscV
MLEKYNFLFINIFWGMLYTKEELKSMERDYNDLIKLTTKHFDLIKICEETLDIL